MRGEARRASWQELTWVTPGLPHRAHDRAVMEDRFEELLLGFFGIEECELQTH